MISAYWAREALEEYTRGPSPEHAAKVLGHLIDAIETLNDDKADKPYEERGV